nr:DUF4157 domain-containing protein [Deinococcus betulae]
MRQRAAEVEGQPLDARQHAQFTALQRQTAQALAQGFRTDRSPATARYEHYGDQLANLQRHPVSAPVAQVVLGLVPGRERLALQRAVDAAVQRQEVREQQAAAFAQTQTLQRQLAELDAEATQPVLQRIQARRGIGNPLPEAIQRHLEQGLNHDLSRVRIHDDAEADGLAKGVNAIAFTIGTDIFFQSGKFSPNTQSGLELLAHEVTHTVQQSQGRVGPGVDPDAGLEAEARSMGIRLAQSSFPHSAKRLLTTTPHTLALSGRFAMQRQYETPLVFSNTVTHDQMFLGGNGQQWADAGTAARMALQQLPSHLGRQFKGIPAELLAGLLTMLRDSALVLTATTALGALIGAFFGGAGAVPGATIGAEMGLAVLNAWGLGAIVAVVGKQLGVLNMSVQSYLALARSAHGNQQRIQAASEALTRGLVVLADAVILAIAALVLKSGVQVMGKTRLGQQIGAKSASSPTIQWLKARQGMTATRVAAGPTVRHLIAQGLVQGRRLMQVTEKLHKQGIRLASGVEKGLDLPADPVLARQAIQIGTVKMRLHPEYSALIGKIRSYGFDIQHKKGVAYVENIQRVNADYSPHSVERRIVIDEDARFLDLRHEFDHVLQIMDTFKGELWTARYMAKPNGGWKLLDTNSNLKSQATGQLMKETHNNALELHVRLKEFFRLRDQGADEKILAEHGVDVVERILDYKKALRNRDEWVRWGAEKLPQFSALIEKFEPYISVYK